MKRTLAALLAAAITLTRWPPARWTPQSQSADTVNVVIGYQSKTINTVTAGTLLKAKGFLEKRLADIGKSTGKKYNVQWQDYDTGAPITAQMVAEKIDIGSMGDYPLLINGSKTQANERARTELVSVTGYSPTGALNMVVVPPDSPARTITDLKGAEGLRQRRLRRPRHAGPRTRQRGHRPEDRRRGAQPAAAGRRLGAGIRSGAGTLAVRRLARPAGLPEQGQAALRRRRGQLPHLPRRRRPPRLRRPAPRGARRVPAGPARRHRVPQPATRWSPPSSSPTAAACPRRSSTSTTAPAAPASTPR